MWDVVGYPPDCAFKCQHKSSLGRISSVEIIFQFPHCSMVHDSAGQPRFHLRANAFMYVVTSPIHTNTHTHILILNLLECGIWLAWYGCQRKILFTAPGPSATLSLWLSVFLPSIHYFRQPFLDWECTLNHLQVSFLSIHRQHAHSTICMPCTYFM